MKILFQFIHVCKRAILYKYRKNSVSLSISFFISFFIELNYLITLIKDIVTLVTDFPSQECVITKNCIKIIIYVVIPPII